MHLHIYACARLYYAILYNDIVYIHIRICVLHVQKIVTLR